MYKKLGKIIFVLFVLLMVSCADSDNSSALKATHEASGPQPYIVVFDKPGIQISAKQAEISVQNKINALSHTYKIQEKKSFSKVIQAGVYDLDRKQVEEIKKNPMVRYVEPDHIVSINQIQDGATWGLDRVDQVEKDLNGQYHYLVDAKNVNAYVIDTGIHTDHRDFEGRALHGYDAVDDDNIARDCNGHGTHVAGTIGSKTYGVAKKVLLHAVRVLDCRGSGRYSTVIEGVEWVSQNHQKPAVANMSLGGPGSKALDEAMEASIAAGVSYVVAAGNSDRDACGSSPARISSAITVGSIEKGDRRSSFSNYGDCVDIFAPGSDITSTWDTTNSAVRTISGTSMASPHVAGGVALYLSLYPEASSEEIKKMILNAASPDLIQDVGRNSPNLLFHLPLLEELPPEENKGDFLAIGDVVENLSGDRGAEVHLQVKIKEEVSSLEIKIQSGIGDADLYVKKGEKATIDSYDCRPYKWGNEERCKLSQVKAGIYQIMVRGYDSFAGLHLEIQ